MTLNDLFQKDIHRPIETVIKADDQENVLTEVEEYVVTREIARKVVDFFGTYNDYQGVNGVWISGFFGSGKSHLLKILSYVLENKAYNGARLGEVFAAKIEDDEMLKGDVLRATRTPSESILFNIDQQAQITSKSDEDAILNVFYKVFNDHLGYFGAQRHVAEFERWLDNDGVYAEFMEFYEAFAKEHWNVGRRKYFAPATKEAIAQALGKIHDDEPAKYKDIIDTLRKDNRISVEDFCEKVAEYLQKKGPDFRLNFFVDEVGQYISENTKLMLNLQTIAETLATKCKGRSWVFATAQEDLEAIVGDQSAVNSDDFSKIQGRFKVRIPLTSANVDEVIEKRLLAKTAAAGQLLAQHWEAEHANLHTILSFSEAGVQFRKFAGARDYVSKFPFVPYQFDLFQQCIKELSKHNAFQGRHASVGERSMLGVFQEVLRKMGPADPHTLVSFDQMFEGIRSTIRGEIQNAITLAERNITDGMPLRVLKTLFLVKYFSNFKTTARNIAVLLLPSTKVDLKAHEKQVQQALNLLENQTYIQRNGDSYVFLTDDEKDVENEIKSTDIDSGAVIQLFNEILFDSIIGDNRIRFQGNKQDYEFTKKIDGTLVGREKELVIEILTPNSDRYGQEDFYKAHSMGYNDLALFVLPPADRLLQDIRLYLKTEKYYKQNISTTNNPALSRIIFEKQQQNVQRKRQLATLLNRLLGEAAVYMNGSKHEVGNTTDGKTKVINAFQDLVKLAYPNLKMLGSIAFSEETLKTILQSQRDDLFGADDATISEAESEVYNLIVRRKKQSDRSSIADLREHFSRKPYGWYASAILCVIARLYKRGKIEARQDSNLLSDADFLASLLNNRTFSNTLLEPQMEFDQRLVRRMKEVYQDLFDEACPATEAREVANQFKERAKKEVRELHQLIGNQAQYPFLEGLRGIADTLERLADMDYSVLLKELPAFEDALLDQKEAVLDPIRKFWNGEQKKIFDRINTFLNGDQSNFDYVDAAELQALRSVRQHPKPYEGNAIKEAREAMEALQHKVTAAIEAEKERTLYRIAEGKNQVVTQPDFFEIEEAMQQKVIAPLDELAERVGRQRYIATLRQYANHVPDMVAEQLTKLQKFVNPEEQIQYVTIRSVQIRFSKAELVSPDDVDEYLRQLKDEMLRHLQHNRRIKL
jgi:predicted transcriptional regulator